MTYARGAMEWRILICLNEIELQGKSREETEKAGMDDSRSSEHERHVEQFEGRVGADEHALARALPLFRAKRRRAIPGQ